VDGSGARGAAVSHANVGLSENLFLVETFSYRNAKFGAGNPYVEKPLVVKIKY